MNSSLSAERARSPISLHERIATRLSSVGQRYTAGRRELVEALARSTAPLTMPEILEAVPDMPQSSAYRHLTVLSSCGVVHRLSGTDDSGFFELTDELSGRHHHHVMCGSCGRVVDIASSPRLEKALAAAAELAAEETGFYLDAHRIDLMGTCPDCR